ncbi:hypothetical protein WA158_006846 [Blastocystis sp. Blastoise]
MNYNSSNNLVSPPRKVYKLRGPSIKLNEIESINSQESTSFKVSKNSKKHRKPGRPPKIKPGPKTKENAKQGSKINKNKYSVIKKICEGNKLLCKCCHKYINLKLSSLRKHLSSSHHVQLSLHMYENSICKMNEIQNEEVNNDNQLFYIYQSLIHSISLGLAITLFKNDEKRMELYYNPEESRILPSYPLMINTYIPELATIIKQRIAQYLNDKEISIGIDESRNIKGQSVLSIMAKNLNSHNITEPFFCLGMFKIDNQTSKTIRYTLFHSLSMYNINFMNIRVFNSDNCSTMMNIAEKIESMNEDCVWIGCLCHIMDLVGNELIAGFKSCSTFMEFYGLLGLNVTLSIDYISTIFANSFFIIKKE